jgi:hypothetical protein
MSAHEHLLVRSNNLPNQHIVLSPRDLASARQHADVIDPFENNQVANPRLSDHIMVESGQGIRSQPIGEQVVSAYSLIENREIACAGLRVQAARKPCPPIRSKATDSGLGRTPPDALSRHFTVAATRRICSSMEARRSLASRSATARNAAAVDGQRL